MASLNVKLENFEEECIKSIDSIFDAYFLISKENTVLGYGIKDKLLNLYFGKENLQGKDIFNLFSFQIQQECIEELKQKILENKPQVFEFNIMVNDQIGYYNIFIFTLANDQMLISFRNIDKQKKIEFDLAEEKNTLKNIIDLNPYAIQIKDAEGRHVSHNKAFVEMFKFVPTPEYSIFEDPHLKKRGIVDKLLKLKEGKVVKLGEHWYDVRDSAIEGGYNVDDYPSSPICLKVIAFPVLDTEGKIKNYVIMNEDITEKKKIESELAEERKTLKNIIELNPYAIEIKDAEGRHVSANKAFIDMFKSVPPPDYSIFEDPHLKKRGLLDIISKLKEGKVVKLGEHWYDARDSAIEGDYNVDDYPSSKICHKPVVFPIRDREGKIKNYIFMHEDITERKLAEIELGELRKDLENRVKERTIRLENSEKKYQKAYNRANCFKGLFTHDISNMFHTIGNSIELCDVLLKQGIKNNEMIDYFGVIEQQINRGKKLINNIRNLSEIEESEMPLEPTEIFEKLRSAFQFVKVNFQKREIIINIESIFDEIYVLANDLLLDVFENILINSVLYNKNKAVEIEINISRLIESENEYIKIEFRDNGIGINDTRKEVIFKENYRKRTGSKGMGLGLSLVAKLLDLCEGKIWVEDRIKGDYTQGSNFVILMPEAE